MEEIDNSTVVIIATVKLERNSVIRIIRVTDRDEKFMIKNILPK